MTILDAPEATELLHGMEKILRTGVEAISRVSICMDACYDSSGPSMVVSSKPIWHAAKIALKRGVKIRYITAVTEKNMSFCEEMVSRGIQVRHSDGAKGNFSIDDNKECTIFIVAREGEPPTQAITTNVKSFVVKQQALFDTLWEMAVPSKQKIKEIEEHDRPAIVRPIIEPSEVQELIVKLIRSTEGEILLLFSTANAFYRQERAGTLLVAQEVASNPEVNVRILTNTDERIGAALQKLKSHHKFRVVELQRYLQPKVWTLVIDRKYSLEIQIKDDTKDDYNEAIGFATFSNSEPIVWTHASIFETLWIQSELHKSTNV